MSVATDLNERFDFAQHQGPLELVIRLVGGSVLVNMFGQFTDKVLDELHFLEQKTDDNETGIISKLLDHQVGSVFFGRSRVIATGADGRVK